MAKRKPLPDQELLVSLLLYEPGTGKMFWKVRPVEMFSGAGSIQISNARRWNERYAGKEAFPCENPKGCRGYQQANILGQKYLKHRVIWKMVTGNDPDEVDHENGDSSDNSFSNLRDVSSSQNGMNSAISSRNISGVTGVFWHDFAGKWAASIGINGKRKYLGVFHSKDQAVKARKSAERALGFHEAHGKRTPAKRGQCK